MERGAEAFYCCSRRRCDFQMTEAAFAAFVDPNDQEASARAFPGFLSMESKPVRAVRRRKWSASVVESSDSEVEAWDAEIDRWIRTGHPGPLLGRLQLSEADTAWVLAHRGETLPRLMNDLAHLNFPRAEVARAQLEAAIKPYGREMIIDGARVWTDNHSTDREQHEVARARRHIAHQQLLREVRAREQGRTARRRRLKRGRPGGQAVAFHLLPLSYEQAPVPPADRRGTFCVPEEQQATPAAELLTA